MTLEELKALLETSGLPVVYHAWPMGGAPPLPYLCYLETGSRNFAADGRVYLPVRHLQIELYTSIKDPQTEDKVENALSSLFWEKTETWLDSEKCWQILYEIEV